MNEITKRNLHNLPDLLQAVRSDSHGKPRASELFEILIDFEECKGLAMPELLEIIDSIQELADDRRQK